MECYTYMKPDPPLPGYPEDADLNTPNKDAIATAGFYRAESPLIFQETPSVAFSVICFR